MIMGNFSRDSFKETNILTNLLNLAAPVANPRQYVGVRLQQGVPILDADWNELEDLRRMEMMALVRFFIGSGVPAGTQGFQIQTSATNNNFNIVMGVMLVEGALVLGSGITSYLSQPNAAGLPALTTPGADRTDLVYLDAWEDETDAIQGDPRLINNLIGIETAVRIERKWVVRVQQNAANLAAIVKVAGHKYTELARLRRRGGAPAITNDMIVDLRRTGLTLAENIKVPVFIQMGLETVDVDRFVQMLRGLRTSLFARFRGGQATLPHQTASPLNESVLVVSLQDLRQRAQVGEVQCASRSMDNADALGFMKTLYTAQKDWVGLLASIGNVGNTAQPFITEYTKWLDGSVPDLIKGLKVSVDNNDLVGSVLAQELVNVFLSAVTDNLPEGDVFAIYKAVVPFENLQVGVPYDFTFTIRSNVTLPAAQTEDFNIQVVTSPASWTAVPDRNTITLQNQGGEGVVVVRVTPNAQDNQSMLTVTARAARNPALVSTQPGLNLQIGSQPPIGSFLFYAGPRPNAQNILEIPKAAITGGAGVPLRFAISNSSPTQNRTYETSHFITLDGGASTTGWTPLQAAPTVQTFNLPPSQPPFPFDARVKAPAAVATNTTGTLSVTARLTRIDGNNVADGESLTVQIRFTVV
jgi:hypothetical protein